MMRKWIYFHHAIITFNGVRFPVYNAELGTEAIVNFARWKVDASVGSTCEILASPGSTVD